MKSIITIVLVLLINANVFAQSEKYHKVRIWLEGKAVSSLSGLKVKQFHHLLKQE